MGDMNQKLLISLIIVYIFTGVFSPLFIPGFSLGVLSSLADDDSSLPFDGSELDPSSGFALLDVFDILLSAIDFMITFVLLPFQALIDNSLTGILRVVFFFLGLLNDLVVIFYLKGFI